MGIEIVVVTSYFIDLWYFVFMFICNVVVLDNIWSFGNYVVCFKTLWFSLNAYVDYGFKLLLWISCYFYDVID